MIRRALILAVLAVLPACGGGGNSNTSAPARTPGPQRTFAPGVNPMVHGSVTGSAGTFTGIARDAASNRWYLLSNSPYAPNSKTVDLSAIGSTLTVEATFAPAAGDISLHGYGFVVCAEPPVSGDAPKNAYRVLFEEPSRVDVYRVADGKYKDLTLARPAVPMHDGAAHALRVVVKHTAAGRVDIETFVDGRPSSRGRDDGSAYLKGQWALANLSNSSVASVTVKPARVAAPGK